MDDPRLDPAAHRRALAGLCRINRLSGTDRQVAAALHEGLGGAGARELRVLDVACGGGDVTVAVHRRLRRGGLPVVVDGCDLSPVAVQAAAQRAARDDLPCRFFRHNACEGPLPGGYDGLICMLFCHHLPSPAIVDLLQRMKRAAPVIVVDDLVRGVGGYAGAWVGTRLLSRSPIVHTDGPQSVAAALTPQEMRALAAEAGLGGAQLERHWPWRMRLTWRRP